MKLKNKINQRFADSSNWILNDPSSLVILMMMATIMAGVLFGLLAVLFGLNKNWILTVLFGVFSFAALKQAIKIIGRVRKTSLKEALGGITANEFVWHKNKHGGVVDGSDGYSSDEVRSKSNAGKNKRIREEVGHIYRQSE